MFAKANVDGEGNLYKILYNPELFIYPFVDQEIPEFVSTVPYYYKVTF